MDSKNALLVFEQLRSSKNSTFMVLLLRYGNFSSVFKLEVRDYAARSLTAAHLPGSLGVSFQIITSIRHVHRKCLLSSQLHPTQDLQ
jgi:hypothetical protein